MFRIALPALFAFAAGINGAPRRKKFADAIERIFLIVIGELFALDGLPKSEASGSARTRFVSFLLSP